MHIVVLVGNTYTPLYHFLLKVIEYLTCNFYIVAGVVIEDGKVLMIQEAKPSCRGPWCLPVGIVSRKETLMVRSLEQVFT